MNFVNVNVPTSCMDIFAYQINRVQITINCVVEFFQAGVYAGSGGGVISRHVFVGLSRIKLLKHHISVVLCKVEKSLSAWSDQIEAVSLNICLVSTGSDQTKLLTVSHSTPLEFHNINILYSSSLDYKTGLLHFQDARRVPQPAGQR